jgi:hypothetical protein
MDTTDLIVAASNTMYALKDGGSTAPATFPTPLTTGDLVSLPLGGAFTPSATVKGWYADMLSGSSIITAPTVTRGAVIWSATTPTTDPCSPGATSLTYARAIGNGQNLVVGGTSIVSGANVVKTSVLKLANYSPTSSKGRFKLNFSYGDGTGGPGARDATLDFTLTGGRTGIRFVTTQ